MVVRGPGIDEALHLSNSSDIIFSYMFLIMEGLSHSA